MQSLLRRIERTAIGFRALNSLSKLDRTFPSFQDAWHAARRNAIYSHDDRELAKANLKLSSVTRASDYPALYWLSQIRPEGLKIFDYGGGAGQLYYQYSNMMQADAIQEWIVMDLPESVEIGVALAAERHASKLRFTNSLVDCRGCDVFLAAGSMHYWEKSMRELAEQTSGLPKHLLINRSPFRDDGAAFVGIQHGEGWAVPFVARNLGEFENEVAALEYQLIDRWRVVEKTFNCALLPEHTAPYYGFYFRKTAST